MATASSSGMLMTALARSARSDFELRQTVAAKRLVERGVDHALVGFDAGHEVSMGIEELDVGHGPMAAVLADGGEHAHTLGRKRLAELAIGAHARWQRARPQPLPGPEHEQLKRRVDGQWIGQPGLAEGPLHPRSGRRRPRARSPERRASRPE